MTSPFDVRFDRGARCSELLSGLTTRRALDLLVEKMVPTSSFIILQSLAMAIGHCKKETRSNFKLSRGRRGFKQRTFERSNNSDIVPPTYFCAWAQISLRGGRFCFLGRLAELRLHHEVLRHFCVSS
jgi:hypothetical protein